MLIIADSSPLITLALIDKLAVLDKLYRELHVPAAVFQEVTQAEKPFAEELSCFWTVEQRRSPISWRCKCCPTI